MYEVKYSKASFEEVLQQAYDSLQPEDIKSLLAEVYDILKQEENDFIHSVFSDVYKKKNISFKQWKALSAYAAEFRRKQETKNNKSF